RSGFPRKLGDLDDADFGRYGRARQRASKRSSRSRSVLVRAMTLGNLSEGTQPSKARRRSKEPFGGKMVETPDSKIVSTKTERIAKLAKQAPDMVIKTLAHHMDATWLREAFRRTRKRGATGVDKQTSKGYEQHLERNLAVLRERAKYGG